MNYLIEKVDDVLSVLVDMEKELKVVGNDYSRNVWIKVIDTTIQEYRQKILHQDAIGQQMWRNFFIGIGGFAKDILLNDYYFNPEEFANFLLQKHQMYGILPLEHWKQVGIVTKLDSKICRLINIFNNHIEDCGDESVTDTLKDIIGYCVLGYHLTYRK